MAPHSRIKAFPLLLAVLLAALLVAAPAAAQQAAPWSGVRSLLQQTAVSTARIFSNGELSWATWSWGLTRLDSRDASVPMPGWWEGGLRTRMSPPPPRAHALPPY